MVCHAVNGKKGVPHSRLLVTLCACSLWKFALVKRLLRLFGLAWLGLIGAETALPRAWISKVANLACGDFFPRANVSSPLFGWEY